LVGTANESRWGLQYTYDPWGNFLQQALTSGWAYQHQYTALTNNRLSGYSYDSAGNLLNDGFHNYIYDADNRIKQVDSSGAAYTYDADGNRIRKDVAGSPSTEYIYFGGTPIAEHDVNGGTWSDYIFANGKRICQKRQFRRPHSCPCHGLFQLRIPVVSVCLLKRRWPCRAGDPSGRQADVAAVAVVQYERRDHHGIY
jgi:YD repeat-containing protein